ncbi:MAG: type III pantothenate kinase [Flavobacteriales bacterium]|nr:type III pantothenate kinase [Flavobacteriales bacterium]
MFLLAIDQGNTNLKYAIHHSSKSLIDIKSFRIQSIEQLHNELKNYTIKHAIVCSVATDDKQAKLFHALEDLKISFIQLNASTPLPIKNCYETPHTLGYDRLADAVGAWSLFRGENSLVIDCGTCINYELINKSGEYLGGGISPGLNMRLDALHHYTGKLPVTNPNDFLEKYPGVNTVQSILSATMGGIVGEIDWMINKYQKNFSPLNIILTGGDAPHFGKYLKNKIFAHPNLALYGLLEILSYNIEKE